MPGKRLLTVSKTREYPVTLKRGINVMPHLKHNKGTARPKPGRPLPLITHAAPIIFKCSGMPCSLIALIKEQYTAIEI
jgi:hypothetical protein